MGLLDGSPSQSMVELEGLRFFRALKITDKNAVPFAIAQTDMCPVGRETLLPVNCDASAFKRSE